MPGLDGPSCRQNRILWLPACTNWVTAKERLNARQLIAGLHLVINRPPETLVEPLLKLAKLVIGVAVGLNTTVGLIRKKQELLPLSASNYSATQAQGQTPEQLSVNSEQSTVNSAMKLITDD